jgi:hypothetical protein
MTKQPEPIRVTENPFGDVTDEQIAGVTDRFYLAGYSDVRHQRELDIKAGEKPKPLPRRFQFVSIENQDGVPRGEKALEYRRMGYRPVMWDEAASLGIDLDNSAAVKGPDGNIRVGQQMLMVTDAEKAAYHFKKQRDAVAFQKKQTTHQLEAAAERYNAKFGRNEKTGTRFETEENIFEVE